MRIGSGGVLLVGFAVLVMIITLAVYVNPATIQVHADTSSDFVDLSDAISQLAGTVKYLPINNSDKIAWLNSQIGVLKREVAPKGVDLKYSSYVTSNKVLVTYSIKRGSTFFNGTAGDVNYFMKCTYEGGGTGGEGGSEQTPGPLKFIPNKLCAYGGGGFIDFYWANFFVLNPTSEGYDAQMAFIGPDAVFPIWYVVSLQGAFPVDFSYGYKSFGENQATVNFYMPPAVSVRVGKWWVFKIPGTAYTSMFLVWRNPMGSYGDLIQTTLPGNKVNYLPLYWYDNFIDWLQCFITSFKNGKPFWPPRKFG